VRWVLQPLVEHDCGDFTIADLVGSDSESGFGLLNLFGERLTPEEGDQLTAAGPGASAQKINGVFTITPAETQ
jgi:hypothetical protein